MSRLTSLWEGCSAWVYGAFGMVNQRIRGLGISIQGTHINDIIKKLYWSVYWDSTSQSGFPSVDPNCRGNAIIWPIIDGA